ncbi:hypothetical protein LCGC14_3035480, partial [marine sediment metagenome]
ILDDNGAPKGDRHIVIPTSAGVNLRTLTQLTKANEAGSDDMLRRGILLDIHGFAIRESGGAQIHTKGLVPAADTVIGIEPVGETDIVLSSFNAGHYVAGDAIQFGATDPNIYIVASLTPATNTMTIAKPGLRKATEAADAVTSMADYEAGMAFSRNALQLVARAPAVPEGGDSADDSMLIVDPVSGLPFEIRLYRQYHRVSYEIGMAWGVKAVKPEHLALILGFEGVVT